MPAIKLFVIFLISFLCTSMNAQALSQKEKDELIKQSITEFMHENKISGMAVQLYQNGKPHSYYFGYADVQKKIPVDKNTIFEIGSISKIFLSLLFAQQLDTARMMNNDPITKYLPTLSKSFDDITLLNLATHTSGLPYQTPDTITSQAAFYSYLNKLDLDDAPEDEWIYSNIGMTLLSFALEKATHKNINELYITQIASPLKMHANGLNIPTNQKRYLSQGYNENNKPVPPEKLEILSPAYAFKISSSDMQRFLSAAIGLPGTPDKILYPMRMTQTAYYQLPDQRQGLGWQIYPLTQEAISDLINEDESDILNPLSIEETFQKPIFNGDNLFDKAGTTDGFQSYIALIPNKKSGIAILANRNMQNNDIIILGRKILFKIADIN